MRCRLPSARVCRFRRSSARSISPSRSGATDILPPSSIHSARARSVIRRCCRKRTGSPARISARCRPRWSRTRRCPKRRRTCRSSSRRSASLYCSTIGYDISHVFVPEERRWLRQAVESGRFRAPADPIDPVALLERLTQVETFERFLHRTFPGKTRFSIEGLDMLVPVLDEIIGDSAEFGIRHILLGMAHRGRLNVMAHVLNKPYAQILAEFKEPVAGKVVPGRHVLDGRRQVPRRRAASDQRRRRNGRRGLDAAEPESPRGGRSRSCSAWRAPRGRPPTSRVRRSSSRRAACRS